MQIIRHKADVYPTTAFIITPTASPWNSGHQKQSGKNQRKDASLTRTRSADVVPSSDPCSASGGVFEFRLLQSVIARNTTRRRGYCRNTGPALRARLARLARLARDALKQPWALRILKKKQNKNGSISEAAIRVELNPTQRLSRYPSYL